MTLHTHLARPHKTINANMLHESEKAGAGFNQRVALALTKIFQAMLTFWVIVAWLVVWIVANFTVAHFDPLPWPLMLTLASVPQLPLMIVIMVGQGLLGRKQEIQSEEQFKATLNSYHDIEQVMLHLDRQDEKILEILVMVEGKANASLC